MADGARFCPSCGNQLAAPANPAPKPVAPLQYAVPQPVPSQKPVSAPAKGSAGFFSDRIKVLALADILLILATLLPWVSFNVYVYSQQVSLLDLATMIFRLNDVASGYLGFSYSQSSVSGAVTLTFVVIGLLWLATVLSLAVDAYARFKSKKSSIAAFVTSAICAIIVIVCCFVLDGAIAGQMGSYRGSGGMLGVVSATPWVWAYMIAAIVCAIVHVSARKSRPTAA